MVDEYQIDSRLPQKTLAEKFGVSRTPSGQLTLTIAELHRRVPRSLTRAALHRDLRLLRQNAAEHGEILRAIDVKDGSAALRLMIQHVSSAGELVADVVRTPGGQIGELTPPTI